MKATGIALLFITLSTICYAADVTVRVNGKSIVLRDNHTWDYLADEGQPNPGVLTLTKSNDPNDVVLKSKSGKYQLNVNMEIWHQTTANNAQAEFQFVNGEETGYGVVLFDGLSIPLASMKQILIMNANKIDPNARIADVEECSVNGTSGELVTYLATAANLEFTFFTFIASKDTGTIQYTFYTLSSVFEKMRPLFIDTISGLEF
jgi:hypothetical protein